MKSQSYMTRALQAQDPRYATILGKLGKKVTAPDPKPGQPVEDMAALRKEYQEIVGKRAFNGWDAATLKAKIAEAKDAK
ncbi:hypothetical protein WH297_12900 [Ochrobactrum vermis]|uniref:Uncharacterized protein n=1 Tax=Ochrobactrum vermis TaxID=1827297 RepID=A0ABU8PEH9_9HYPH|nr:hypothetical protein [Ochrobactrum vermis]PQZ30929.1 hypothetical protein CQZ93_13105 [Ochrobactrum vermis]